jgi:hypothetical protein
MSVHWRSKGNTLVEYSLVVALILVSLGVIMTMGKYVNQAMAAFSGDMKKTIEAKAPSPSGGGGGGGGKGSSPLDGVSTVCTNNKICFSLPDSVTQSDVTMGANGVKQAGKSADLLDQLAQALKQDPNADPSLVDLITQLANQGHALADAQSDIYCSTPGYCSTSGNRTKGISNLQSGLSNFKSQLNQIDQKLNTTTAGMNSTLLNVIAQESGTIIGISNNFKISGSSWSYSAAGFGIAQTDVSSNHICGSGGDTGSCVQ